MLHGSARNSFVDPVIGSDGRLSEHLRNHFGDKEIYTAPGAEHVTKM